MSNVKRSYNTSRRIRKGYKERLNRLMLKRPLRHKTKVLSDESRLESPFLQIKVKSSKDQENNISSFKKINYTLKLIKN